MLAQVIGILATQRHPELFTQPRTVDKRDKGRVYLDVPQNRRGSSIAAAYVLRAFPGVAVATPLEWSELRPGLDFKSLNMYSIFERLERTGDLFRPVVEQPQPIEDAIERLARLV
jgi:bifunctional non-homologous end joining protein LigD